ncbi:BQ5605_C041g11972 [Microbotryum silenes-dioicae]|uniref:BQ5605_C041g11972 protein n=1 Tax=Microbotryum silenes-dioicae TaxID=796604 RepID=A0A2X0MR30_9BASI|nr:BQ5605_C041g11972 [Microbotryum silenes-dioicae]
MAGNTTSRPCPCSWCKGASVSKATFYRHHARQPNGPRATEEAAILEVPRQPSMLLAPPGPQSQLFQPPRPTPSWFATRSPQKYTQSAERIVSRKAFVGSSMGAQLNDSALSNDTQAYGSVSSNISHTDAPNSPSLPYESEEFSMNISPELPQIPEGDYDFERASWTGGSMDSFEGHALESDQDVLRQTQLFEMTSALERTSPALQPLDNYSSSSLPFDDDDPLVVEELWGADQRLDANGVYNTPTTSRLSSSQERAVAEEEVRQEIELAKALPYYDVDTLYDFSFRHMYNMTRQASKIWEVLGSRPSLQKFVDLGLKPVRIPCCVKTCVAFTGPREALTRCPVCNSPKLDQNGHPQNTFLYLSPDVYLNIYLRDRVYASLMRYRSDFERNRDPQEVVDLFDGDRYREKLDQNISWTNPPIAGASQPTVSTINVKYYENDVDVAFGLFTDGIQLFNKTQSECWPIMMINYNLPPEIRYKKKHLMTVGIIPGPKGPKDIDSFLHPLYEDARASARNGHMVFDGVTETMVRQRWFIHVIGGDGPALSKMLGFKGPTAKWPCRVCLIQGVPCAAAHNHNYYPLKMPLDSSHANRSDLTALDLPMRSEVTIREAASEKKPTFGLCKLSSAAHLPGFSLHQDGPSDFMHAVFENVARKLFNMWHGDLAAQKSKGHKTQAPQAQRGRSAQGKVTSAASAEATMSAAAVDEALGTDLPDWVIPNKIWEVIGQEITNGAKTIPSLFARKMPNIHLQTGAMTAEDWSNWILYVGPCVLHDRLPAKYFAHFLALRRWVKDCMAMTINKEDVAKDGALRRDIASWCTEFESHLTLICLVYLGFRLYYSGKSAHLINLPHSVHAVLHIADFIEWHGPPAMTWCFAMERLNQTVKRVASKAHRLPYEAVNRYVCADAALQMACSRFPRFSYPITVPALMKHQQDKQMELNQMQQSRGLFMNATGDQMRGSSAAASRQASSENGDSGAEALGLYGRRSDKLKQGPGINDVMRVAQFIARESFGQLAPVVFKRKVDAIRTSILSLSINSFEGYRMDSGQDRIAAAERLSKHARVSADTRDASWISYDLLIDSSRRRAKDNSQAFPREGEGADRVKHFGQLLAIYEFRYGEQNFLLGKVRSLGLSHLQPVDTVERAPIAKPTPKRQKRKASSVVGGHKHQNLFFTQGKRASGAVEIVDLRCILGSAGRTHRRVGREESREYIFDRMDDEARPNFLNLE